MLFFFLMLLKLSFNEWDKVMLLPKISQPGGKEPRGLSLNTCFSLSKVGSKNILMPWRTWCLCISSPFRPRLPSLEGKLRDIFCKEQRNTRSMQCYIWVLCCPFHFFNLCTVELWVVFPLILNFSVPFKFPVRSIWFLIIKTNKY